VPAASASARDLVAAFALGVLVLDQLGDVGFGDAAVPDVVGVTRRAGPGQQPSCSRQRPP
jgi:hypothetical protein